MFFYLNKFFIICIIELKVAVFSEKTRQIIVQHSRKPAWLTISLSMYYLSYLIFMTP